ncbi:hypothetical protein QCA50_005916 [Cerrena zonata]|uniref:N-acetyltransferase domain-containing protein n=1 Tax=Cerrena zonata TaxID=2478898 RepID=A0AAW0GBS0_9APHY
MTQNDQHQLHFDEITGEPYLRLPNPLENYIITPTRIDDAPAIVNILNGPGVAKWLAAIPKPYTLSDGEWWVGFTREAEEKWLTQMRESGPSSKSPFGGCPLKCIRHVKEDGTQVLVGNVGVGRCSFSYLEDDQKAKQLAAENERRSIGDPEIVWALGDYLSVSYHGQGIMTAAIRTIINDWMIPRMGVRCIIVDPYLGNRGSVRVFEKNGFVLESVTSKKIVTLGGDIHEGQNVLIWRKEWCIEDI